MATHSSILTWEIPWTEEPGGLQSMESLESDMTEIELRTHLVAVFVSITVAGLNTLDTQHVYSSFYSLHLAQNRTQRKYFININ